MTWLALSWNRAAPSLGRRTLLTGVLLQLPYGLAFAWGALVPHVRSELGWSPLLVGAVFSATPLGYGVGTLVGGRLADRLPPRWICAAGVGLLVAGLLVALTLPSGLTFVCFYGFTALGVGGGVALSGSVAAAARLYPARAGTTGGALTAAYASASIVLAPLLVVLAPRFGWLTALRWIAALVVSLAVVALALMPSLTGAQNTSGFTPAPPQLRLLRRPRIWTGCVVVLLAALLGPYAAVNLVTDAQAHHVIAWAAGTSLVLFSCGNALGRLASGAAADEVGVDRVAVVVLACSGLAAGLLVTGAGTAPLLAASLAAGAGLGGAAGLLSRLAADGAPDAPNSAFGLLFAAYAAGALAGPLAGAAAGGGTASWLVVGVPAAGGLVMLWRRRRL